MWGLFCKFRAPVVHWGGEVKQSQKLKGWKANKVEEPYSRSFTNLLNPLSFIPNPFKHRINMAPLPEHPNLVVLQNRSLLGLFTKIRNKNTSPGKLWKETQLFDTLPCDDKRDEFQTLENTQCRFINVSLAAKTFHAPLITHYIPTA